ncbi:MAG: heme o synthase [Bacteroidota bacterium]
MNETYTASPSLAVRIRTKIGAYVQLLKLRLSLLVAISAVFGYAIAAAGTAGWDMLFWIGLGGLLVTGASNVLNQVFEKHLDAQMQRTMQRPMPTGKIGDGGALVYAMLLAITGISILGYFFNLQAALLGIIGLLSYAFVYTPMKRLSRFSVFVGAIPGGLPPLIGWAAFTGGLETGGLILFAFQFFWQFPHFWAIAWRLDEDYQRVGFKMLPTSSGKSRSTATLILMYTLALVPMVFFPWQADMMGLPGVTALAGLGLLFAWPAVKLWRSLADKDAKTLMFASFLYLPLAQLVFLLA